MNQDRIRIGVIGSTVNKRVVESFGFRIEDDGHSDGSSLATTALMTSLAAALGPLTCSLTVVIASPLRFGISSAAELARSIHWLSNRRVSLVILLLENACDLPGEAIDRLKALECRVCWVLDSSDVREIESEIREREVS